jgi:hypothetical protein
MSAEETQLFRDTVLLILRNYPRGLNRERLDTCLRAGGLDHFTFRDMDFHLEYLGGKNLIAKADKSHSVGNALWKLTAAGVDDLEGRGL